MRKRRVIAAAAAFVTALGIVLMPKGALLGAGTVFAAEASYEAIIDCRCEIESKQGGLMECSAYGRVDAGCEAELTLELQRYDDGWDSVISWSGNGEEIAAVSKSRYVERGYQYRVKLVCSVYGDDGEFIEKTTVYSKKVSYDK